MTRPLTKPTWLEGIGPVLHTCYSFSALQPEGFKCNLFVSLPIEKCFISLYCLQEKAKALITWVGFAYLPTELSPCPQASLHPLLPLTSGLKAVLLGILIMSHSLFLLFVPFSISFSPPSGASEPSCVLFPFWFCLKHFSFCSCLLTSAYSPSLISDFSFPQ